MKTTPLSSLLRIVGAGVALAFAPISANAAPILGANVVVATDGTVIAKFLGHTAGYTNELYLSLPLNGLGVIFNNHTTPIGTTFNLGSFSAGTELIFKIYVLNTGDEFFTGQASRNPDNLIHAIVDDAYSPTETYVGFEDLLGGGDLDYDDLQFSFTNVRATPTSTVPDHSTTVGLLGIGLLGLAFIRRRLS